MDVVQVEAAEVQSVVELKSLRRIWVALAMRTDSGMMERVPMEVKDGIGSSLEFGLVLVLLVYC